MATDTADEVDPAAGTERVISMVPSNPVVLKALNLDALKSLVTETLDRINGMSLFMVDVPCNSETTEQEFAAFHAQMDSTLPWFLRGCLGKWYQGGFIYTIRVQLTPPSKGVFA